MKSIGKFVHLALVVVFLAVLAAIPLQAKAAEVSFSLTWSAPIDGGPVTSYSAVCLDAAGATVLEADTEETSAFATASGVATGQGVCSIRAIGPGGEGGPAMAAFSVAVTAPPGVPQEVTITLQCSVADGIAVCEQV